MIPLTFCDSGKEYIIRSIGGNSVVRQRLANMGFVAGSCVTVLSETCGNLIVRIKETRVALSRETAHKIMI